VFPLRGFLFPEAVLCGLSENPEFQKVPGWRIRHRASETPSLIVAALRDELIDRQNFIPARLESFGAATRDLAAPCLQGRLNRSLKSTALVCLDLNEKDRLIRYGPFRR
jgi:hypothetical protein